MAIRTRRDAWKLAVWDDVMLWYAKAVGEMQKRALDEPKGWRYQAGIHEYRRNSDPLAQPGDRLPSTADQRRFWSQCQHNSWYFLPWHRWYLYYFEAIVIDTIATLGGPASTWALPFWNYSDDANPDARKIPPAFRETHLPTGEANPLYVPDQNRFFGNDGAIIADDADVSLDCLNQQRFETDAVDVGFGGPKTRFNHGGGTFGAVERTPHGSMHVAVNGWLGAFNTAGLDPLFWAHHANIDRLWAVWRGLSATNVDPVDPDWLTMSFDFHDASGAAVSRIVGDAVDPTTLGYCYEGVAAVAPALAAAASVSEKTMAKERVPEMVGASEGPIALGEQPTGAAVALAAPTGPAAAAAKDADGGPERLFLNIENVTGAGHPRRYSVYLNDIYVGIIPLFGIEEATAETQAHPGGGLHFRLDATNAVDQLRAAGKWDEATAQVTFVPDERGAAMAQKSAAAAAAATSATPQFQVGRVRVYRA